MNPAVVKSERTSAYAQFMFKFIALELCLSRFSETLRLGAGGKQGAKFAYCSHGNPQV